MQPPPYTAEPPLEKPAEGEKPQSFPWASLELLKNYGKGSNYINAPPEPPTAGSGSGSTRKLSLGETIKMAGELFIHLSSHRVDGFSTSVHPYPSAFMSELSPPEMADVELVQVLLLAAECVRQRQFDLASGLITRCLWIASVDGNPTQRIVFYFAEALQRRVEVETGRTTVERQNEQSSYAKSLAMDFNVAFLSLHQALPFNQVMQFAAMQTIADHLNSAGKIHLVDIHIRSGIQWTILMQSMAEREDPPEIRITAVGTTTNRRHVEESGKRLVSFAESLKLTFSYDSIILSDMKELKEDMFVRAGESVAVYAPLILRTMLSTPDSLGSVMRVVRRLKPAVVVVMEVEANHNSTSFINRFTESLFYYGAFFDCIGDCLPEGKNDEDRKIIEGIYLGEGIRNMVGTDGDTRCTRNVTMEVWREFFARYGMAEVELGDAAFRQANLMLNKFPPAAASSCNVTTIGKGLLVGWKGTPIHSLTTWKFS